MDSQVVPSLLSLGVGGLAGYQLGKNSVTQPEVDPTSDAATIAGLNQRIALLQAQSEAQAALVAAMKDQSTTGLAVQAQLQAQINDLSSKLSGQQVTLFNNFPAVFGTGDPAVGGWIKGRDGLLINRVLPNFIPMKSLITTVAGYDKTWATTSIAISDITTKLAARPITIGRSVNNTLRVSHFNGIFGSMATILNFAEEVADDPDFTCSASIYDNGTYHASCLAIPIGRNSLMLLPGTIVNVPRGYNYEDWNANMLKDCTQAAASGGIAIPTLAQRGSYISGRQGITLQLSHRTARSLTLRSWNIVAHPLAQWQETWRMNLTDLGDTNSRRQGATSVVTRMNTSLTPKFFRPNDQGDYDTVDVTQSSYM